MTYPPKGESVSGGQLTSMELKCAKCGGDTDGFKCSICGAEAREEVLEHKHPESERPMMPKCKACGQADINCTCV
jgi:RecJ-like exonuclease